VGGSPEPHDAAFNSLPWLSVLPRKPSRRLVSPPRNSVQYSFVILQSCRLPISLSDSLGQLPSFLRRQSRAERETAAFLGSRPCSSQGQALRGNDTRFLGYLPSEQRDIIFGNHYSQRPQRAITTSPRLDTRPHNSSLSRLVWPDGRRFPNYNRFRQEWLSPCDTPQRPHQIGRASCRERV